MLTKKQLSMQVIMKARSIFANTPIQKLRITTFIYKKVFKYGYSDEEITIDFRGIKLTIPTKDVTIVPGLAGGFYEKIELDIYQELAAKSKVIFDVGGSIGDYTCVGAKYLPENGKIVVFEPIKENIGYINRNVYQNKLRDKVIVEAVAVGDKDGQITMYTVEGSVGTHSAAKKSAAGVSKNSSIVPVVSIDSYVKKQKIKKIDILKIDIEGYDGFALKGATKVLSELHPTIFIEFVSDNLINCGFDPREFLNILQLNYEKIFLIDETKSSIKECSQEDLNGLIKKSINANLIVVRNVEHLGVVECYLSKSNK